jgi:sulfate permease, SulP family
MHIFPSWWRQYQPDKLKSDLVAGLLVTILVLPQSLAYALLAGLPPQMGLLASTLPVLAYALVGSSMTQAVGPVAITSIMTFSVLSPLALPGTSHYFAMSTTLALLSGLLVIAFGMLRLGFLSNLLSRPVIGGFISGSALLILLSQIKLLLGIQVHASSSWDLLLSTLEQLPQTNLRTAFIVSKFLSTTACTERYFFLACRNDSPFDPLTGRSRSHILCGGIGFGSRIWCTRCG